MNNLIKVILFYILLTFFARCLNKQKTDSNEIGTIVNELQGKKITINDSVFYKNCITNYRDKKYKIITSIDGDCSCSFGSLEKWQKYISKNKSVAKKAEVVIFITSEYDFLIYEEVFKEIAPDICLIFDPDNAYINMNNLKYESNALMTFLTDSTNTVKLIGNPVSNNKIKRLFITYLSNN